MSKPRIAVITPYHREPDDYLAKCHHSVMAQGVDVDHFMIADGHPRDCVDTWAVSHVKLPRSHDDDGNTPRGLGGLLAAAEGYEFIAYLDADNWYHDGHLRSLLDLWEQRRASVCSSFRTFHDPAGDDLGIEEPAENALKHVDTSCLLIHRSGYDCLSLWLDIPKRLTRMCDRILLAAMLHRGYHIASTGARTVAFRTRYHYHYRLASRPAPAGAKGEDILAEGLAYLATREGVSECVSKLGFWPLTYME